MFEIKGFITNLGKYNEGELVGKWITFPIDEDDLNEVYKEIGMDYEDEDGNEVRTGYEEYFFTDWDNEVDLDLGEYENIDKLNELAESLQAWEDDEDIFKAACEMWSFDEVVNNSPDDYHLYSDIHTDYALGEYYAIECCCVDFGENAILERYFDFEAYGRDIRFESDGGFTNQGWIEYVG